MRIQVHCTKCGQTSIGQSPCDHGLEFLKLQEAEAARKEKKRQRSKRERAKKAQQKQQSKGASAPITLFTDTQCDDCVTEEERYHHSLMNMASEAASLPAYWTQQFGDWQSLSVTKEMIALAEDAAAAWSEISAALKKRMKSNGSKTASKEAKDQTTQQGEDLHRTAWG